MDSSKYFKKVSKRREFEIWFEVRKHGWIWLHLSFPGLKIEVHLSSAFDPIPELLNWVMRMKEQEASCFLKIDEEGHFKRLIMERYRSLEDDLYEFRLQSDRAGPYHEYEFTKVLSRSTFLNEFTSALGRLADDAVESWCDYDLPALIRETIEIIRADEFA